MKWSNATPAETAALKTVVRAGVNLVIQIGRAIKNGEGERRGAEALKWQSASDDLVDAGIAITQLD